MVHPDLLEILACPEDKTPVHLMEAGALAALNERIGKGAVKTRGGQPVTDPVPEALVRAGRQVRLPRSRRHPDHARRRGDPARGLSFPGGGPFGSCPARVDRPKMAPS